MGTDTVLCARGVCRSFPGVDEDLVVLDGADLEVHRGEVVGIVGASGVGKSTLLHVLGSLDRPNHGEIEVGGFALDGLRGRALDSMRSRVLGFVFQFHFLLPDFNALENVMMPMLVAGKPTLEAQRVAQDWLDRVGLTERSTHRPGELSGGEQQRVAVARALVNNPAVVLADEPTGNLDQDTGDGVLRLIRELADRDAQTFVVVTHKQDFVRFADRMLELSQGRLRPLNGTT